MIKMIGPTEWWCKNIYGLNNNIWYHNMIIKHDKITKMYVNGVEIFSDDDGNNKYALMLSESKNKILFILLISPFA